MALRPSHQGFTGIADCPSQPGFMYFGSRPHALVAGLWVTRASLNKAVRAYVPTDPVNTPQERMAALFMVLHEHCDTEVTPIFMELKDIKDAFEALQPHLSRSTITSTLGYQLNILEVADLVESKMAGNRGDRMGHCLRSKWG